MMMTTIKGQFETRRAAEMAVERMVQDYHIERTDIFVVASGANNTAGVKAAGSDNPTIGEASSADGAALNGTIEVSADIDVARAENVRAAFAEFSRDGEVAPTGDLGGQ